MRGHREALTFFGDPVMAESAAGAFDKGRRLAQLVGERRALLIFDGLEPLQCAATSPTSGELKDQGLGALLKGLAATSRGLCVVTTRYSIRDLRAHWQTTAPETMLRRLSAEAGVALLRKLGVNGNQQEFEALVSDVKGHALTLNLLGTFLRDAHGGDIRRRDVVKLEEADAEEQGGHAFRVMDAYVQSLETGGRTEEENQKGASGARDPPASRPIRPPGDSQLPERLEDATLITVNGDPANRLPTLDSHPFIREYFARHAREEQPEAWSARWRWSLRHSAAIANRVQKCAKRYSLGSIHTVNSAAYGRPT